MNPQTHDKFQDPPTPFGAGIINVWSLNSGTFNIAISADSSCKLRRWNSCDGMVDACFENQKKVIDIICKRTKCRECSIKKRDLQSRSTEETDYVEWYVSHEQKSCEPWGICGGKKIKIFVLLRTHSRKIMLLQCLILRFADLSVY